MRHLYPTCTGLGKLAEKVLGISLDKNSDVRYSNWEGYLSSESLIYAAKDAYVSMKVFKKWLCDELSVLQLKEMDIYTTLMREKNIYRRLERLFDVEFDIKSLQRKLQKNSRNETDELLLPQTIQTMEKKIYNSGHATRKTPLYQNCFMYAPDGELLCSCDTRLQN